MDPKWKEAMYEELATMPLVDQVVATGDWITLMTQELLPRLAQIRRSAIVSILADEEWDPVRLAETIGSRPGAIKRLAEEGRRQERQQHQS